jgi:hypothetical protein
MTCALIQRLKHLLGDGIQLVDTKWHGADDLLRECRERDGGV